MNRFLTLTAPIALISASAAMAAPMTSREYVKTAGASDLFERQSAQVVLDTTANPAIRSFAQMMLKAHSQSTAKVKAAAAKARMRVAPPVLTAMQREQIAQLRATADTDRDALYITQQRTAHDGALKVQEAYAKGGTVRSLRTAAASIVPVVKLHIAMLATL